MLNIQKFKIDYESAKSLENKVASNGSEQHPAYISVCEFKFVRYMNILKKKLVLIKK